MPKRSAKDLARGKRLAKLRTSNDWSAIHIAQRAGVSKGRIYAWEKGDPISSQSVSAVANALETTREYILTGNGPASRPTNGELGAVDRIEAMLRDLKAGQYELTAQILNVERLLEAQQNQQQPAARKREAGGK